jgi:hypothetical protein
VVASIRTPPQTGLGQRPMSARPTGRLLSLQALDVLAVLCANPHPGELYPWAGFIVTNLSRPPENFVAFYNQRGTCEQWIKEGKGVIKWTRLSCRSFVANAVRLQLHALAYNLGNFLRTLATPEPITDWSLTSLKEKLIKIGANGHQPRPLCCVPDGRGRYSEATLRQHPAADRRTAAPARSNARMNGLVVMRSSENQGSGAS